MWRILAWPPLALAWVALAGWAAPASAQVCEGSELQSSLQYLRRASLDLRGALPTVEELEAVVAAGEVDLAVIESMLEGEDFEHQMRAYHRDLLWTNLDNQRLTAVIWNLVGPGDRGALASPAFWAPQRSDRYRGGRFPCKDEPAAFGREGEILTTPHPTEGRVVQEGWVEVSPYWAPTTTVRVCAFDAQEALRVPNLANPNQPQLECSSTGAQDARCGCGPNLSFCQVRVGQLDTRLEIVRSFSEQLLRYGDEVVREGRPYTDFLLGTEMEINGPLSHYLRFQTRTGGGNFLGLPTQGYEVPEIGFDEGDRWVKIERGERHAGVLTMPGYLVKFQTNRSRANRFYNAFLCQYFEAPPGGLPASDDPCSEEPNLTERCGCKFCHVSVEPAAAYWGRFAEAGLASLNEDVFPKFNRACSTPQSARNPLCRFFYLTEAGHPDEAPYVGMMLPYVFADAVREENIELGPAALAQEAVESGDFARCTTRKMWRSLMGREPLVEDEPVVEALAEDFIANDYDLRELVLSLVTRPEYIEGERFGREVSR